MKKLTNVQKVLKALKSGAKTQADLMRETKVKNVYQIISDLKKKKLVFVDTGKCVNLIKIPVAVDETDKVSSEEIGNWPWPDSEVVKTLKNEVENIDDGIRSLEIAKSYLQRRIEEEKRDA